MQGVLLLSLFANGIVVATVAARSQSDRPVLLTSSVLSEVAPPAPARTVAFDTASAVERRILEMVVQSPGKRCREG